jgi:ATP-dependent helicase/nuclease subunit A
MGFSKILDTDESCFVFASAGSGKTKNLVDRFLKLALGGIDPNKILCLTFTNAAAFEMQARIISALEKLLTNSDQIFADRSGIEAVYNKIIGSIESLKIQTVHSFCQKLLQTFPIEAGLSSGFEILDDLDAEDLLQEAQDYTLRNLFDTEPQTIKEILEFCSDWSFKNIIKNLYRSSSKIRRFFAKLNAIKSYELRLKKLFCWQEQQLIPAEELNAAIMLINNAKSIDPKEIFLTKKDGSIRKNLPKTKEIESIATIVFNNSQNLKKEKTISKTICFLKVIEKILQKFDELKKKNNVLDFSDIIQKTEYLLTNKDFVLRTVYDSISHVMCDEAQDMSKSQWDLLSIVTNKILSDQNTKKTIFIVGDIKQSIYGFQDAAPSYFIDYYNSCLNLAKQNGKLVNTEQLNKNYRTTSLILSNIDKVFDNSVSSFAFEGQAYSAHICAFPDNKQGIFECITIQNDDLSDEEKASAVASILKNIINNHRDQIMILVRDRSPMIEKIYNELLAKGINVSLDNKIKLYDETVSRVEPVCEDLPKRFIVDLVDFLDICVGNYSDYKMAHVLKSPYIFTNFLQEEELFNLCYKRKSLLLDTIMQTPDSRFKEFQNVILKYSELALKSSATSFLFDIYRNQLKIADKQINKVVTEFLLYAFNFFKKKNDSLRDFIKFFKSHDVKIKNNSSSDIKMQTIHSSKGQESNIVVLLDFSKKANKSKAKFLWSENLTNVDFIIKPNQHDSFYEIEGIIKEHYQKEEQELLRLLYVAMTRARLALYMIGPLFKKEEGAYELVAKI